VCFGPKGSGDICFAALSAYPAADAIADDEDNEDEGREHDRDNGETAREIHKCGNGIFIQNNAPSATGM